MLYFISHLPQVSGAAPAPLPSQQPNEKKKLAKAKLKQIAAEAKKSTPSVNEKSAEKEKLAKQIKKNIAAKLARPLKKKAKVGIFKVVSLKYSWIKFPQVFLLTKLYLFICGH